MRCLLALNFFCALPRHAHANLSFERLYRSHVYTITEGDPAAHRKGNRVAVARILCQLQYFATTSTSMSASAAHPDANVGTDGVVFKRRVLTPEHAWGPCEWKASEQIITAPCTISHTDKIEDVPGAAQVTALRTGPLAMHGRDLHRCFCGSKHHAMCMPNVYLDLIHACLRALDRPLNVPRR